MNGDALATYLSMTTVVQTRVSKKNKIKSVAALIAKISQIFKPKTTQFLPISFGENLLKNFRLVVLSLKSLSSNK
jgi:hypothetical protein